MLIKRTFLTTLAAIISITLTACSETTTTDQIRATLFLLDASKSTISSVSAREIQLKQRLEDVFEKQEAVYFDFVRSDFTKQKITPLISMQTIVNINDAILKDAIDEQVREETKEIVSSLWIQALNDSNNQLNCDKSTVGQLTLQTVLSDSGARSVGRNLCSSAARAKQAFQDIRIIGSGQVPENSYIGSDIQGAFIRGIERLESESRNIINSENRIVGVAATILVSSDMMQRNASGVRVIDEISNLTEEQIEEYVIAARGNSEFRTIRPKVIIDGWLSTKKNFGERERNLLETYWKSWFRTLDLDEPDFGFGIVDWSVTQ